MNNVIRDNVVIIPLYNDWESLQFLIPELLTVLKSNKNSTKILIIDDFSLVGLPNYLSEYKNVITVLELTRNVGHQKAISIGLAYAINNFPNVDNFIIMDSDGEDMPGDIPGLIESINENNIGICFAQRKKRNETFVFKLFYKVYKNIFHLLTGKKISFGNFCVLTAESANRIIHVSEIWLHFSSGVIKSKLPYCQIPTQRGVRYHGNSKMNFTNLVNHGLSAIAVYSELVAVRITLISILMSVLSGSMIFIIFCIRQLTSLAIPGWASFVTLGLLILIAQFFSLGILLSFIILSAKTVKNINPSTIYTEFIYKSHIF